MHSKQNIAIPHSYHAHIFTIQIKHKLKTLGWMIRGRNWFVLNYKITKSAYSITIVLSRACNTFFAIKFVEKNARKMRRKSSLYWERVERIDASISYRNNKFNWFRTTLVLCSYNNYCKQCNMLFYWSFIWLFLVIIKILHPNLSVMCENHNNDLHRCFYSSSPILMGFWRYNAVVSRCHRG